MFISINKDRIIYDLVKITNYLDLFGFEFISYT